MQAPTPLSIARGLLKGKVAGRVPPKVLGGSIQLSQKYKQWHSKASSALKLGGRPTLDQLQQLNSEHSEFI